MADFDLEQVARKMAARDAEIARVEQEKQNRDNETVRNLASAVSRYAASIGTDVKSVSTHFGTATIETGRGKLVLTIIYDESCKMEVDPSDATDLAYSDIYNNPVFSFTDVQERLVDWLNGR